MNFECHHPSKKTVDSKRRNFAGEFFVKNCNGLLANCRAQPADGRRRTRRPCASQFYLETSPGSNSTDLLRNVAGSSGLPAIHHESSYNLFFRCVCGVDLPLKTKIWLQIARGKVGVRLRTAGTRLWACVISSCYLPYSVANALVVAFISPSGYWPGAGVDAFCGTFCQPYTATCAAAEFCAMVL